MRRLKANIESEGFDFITLFQTENDLWKNKIFISDELIGLRMIRWGNCSLNRIIFGPTIIPFDSLYKVTNSIALMQSDNLFKTNSLRQ